MNGIHGFISTDRPEGSASFDRLTSAHTELEFTHVRTISCRDSKHRIAVSGEHGNAVVAALHDGARGIAISGLITGPFPEASAFHPMDDLTTTLQHLLERYVRLGERFLDGVVGQYVIALFDSESDVHVIACDPYRGRRVFVHVGDHGLAYATSLGALGRGLGLGIDRSLEDFLLGCEFVPWDRTPVASVKSLAAGTMLILEQSRIRHRPIARAVFSGADGTPDYAATRTQLHGLFLDTLGQIVPDREPRVGVLLGGFDSALVAAGLKAIGKDVETFTFCFNDAKYDQRFVAELGDVLGIRHHPVVIRPEHIASGLREYSRHFNNISSQPHYLIQSRLCTDAMKARGIRYCVTGDGCDEVFLGYPMVYSRAQLFRRAPRLSRRTGRVLQTLLAADPIERRLGHVARFARNFLNNSTRPHPVRGHITNRILDDYTLRRLRRNPPPPEQDRDFEQTLYDLAYPLRHLDPVQLAFHGKAAPGLSRAKQEGCMTASGVAVTSPYQHPAFGSFAAAIPEAFKRSDTDRGLGKAILTDMALSHQMLPERIVYQRKDSPVNAPVDHWYMNELHDDLLAQLEDLPFSFDENYVRGLLQPRLAEEWFRNHVSYGHYAFNVPALLASYASLHRHLS